jgi:integrase
LKQAETEAKRIIGQVASGVVPGRRKPKVGTFGDFLSEYYEGYVRTHHKSRASDADRLRKVFSDLLPMPLTDIKWIHVERIRQARQDDGIQKTTINRDIAALKASFSVAVKEGLLAANPLAKMTPMKIDKEPATRALTDDEERRIMDAIGMSPAYLKPMVVVSLYTGLRQGELFSLQWDDVDLAAGMLTVRGFNAKSKQTRYVNLNETALRALREWKSSDTGLVFPGKTGGQTNNVKRSFASLLKRADVHSFRWHDMRHSFASKLVQAGVDLNTVRELMGHCDIKMTLRYAHLAPKHKALAVAQIG